MLDLLSGGPFGIATISLGVASLVASLSRLNVPQTSAWLPLAAGVLATVAYNVAYLALLRISGRSIPWGSSLLHIVLPLIALNALATYPTYWAMRWLHARTSYERLQW